jgi:hypothetical protein
MTHLLTKIGATCAYVTTPCLPTPCRPWLEVPPKTTGRNASPTNVTPKDTSDTRVKEVKHVLNSVDSRRAGYATAGKLCRGIFVAVMIWSECHER